jgi:hypothetical protein
MKTKLLYWLPMPVIATLNGIFRGWILIPLLSPIHARQVSSILLILILALYTRIIYAKLRIHFVADALFTGLIWVLLTIAFEFLLGYIILKHSIDVMLMEYNLIAGNLWSLVLVSLFFLPYLYFRYEAKISNTTNAH